ncbi:MAG: TldD/PmbA family protein [Candidatus Methanodesulfokora sp.]
MDPEEAISYALDLGAEFVEIRHQKISVTEVFVVNGVIRRLSSGDESGYSVRVLLDGSWGFSSGPSLKELVDSSLKLAKSHKGEKIEIKGRSFSGSYISSVKVPPDQISVERKARDAVELCKRGMINEVRNFNVSYVDGAVEEEVFNSIGTKVRQKIYRTRVSFSAYAHRAGITERAMESAGGTRGYEVVEESAELAETAAKRAVELLSAKSAPAGKFQAVIDPKLAGVFVHEAFGHAAEADEVLAGMSVLEGRIGQRVGENVNIVDDPTIEGLYGSYKFDSEGSEGRRKLIVEGGVLKGFMHNLETSSKMGVESTGNGRAMDFRNPPIVRMSNTFIDRGDADLDEILRIKEGIYAMGSLYGYTEPAKGQFMFKAEEGWLIRNGELVEKLREVAIAGNTLDILRNIELVGKDLRFSPGTCGKDGQWVPVTTGSPHIRVREVVFGGLR